jgi:hypothetical protein
VRTTGLHPNNAAVISVFIITLNHAFINFIAWFSICAIGEDGTTDKYTISHTTPHLTDGSATLVLKKWASIRNPVYSLLHVSLLRIQSVHDQCLQRKSRCQCLTSSTVMERSLAQPYRPISPKELASRPFLGPVKGAARCGSAESRLPRATAYSARILHTKLNDRVRTAV